jgi:hypothetical protein
MVSLATIFYSSESIWAVFLLLSKKYAIAPKALLRLGPPVICTIFTSCELKLANSYLFYGIYFIYSSSSSYYLFLGWLTLIMNFTISKIFLQSSLKVCAQKQKKNKIKFKI